MPSAIKPSRAANQFDLEYDVVVVGYGYAGGISSIVAADNGAKVLLIEKSAVPGGISDLLLRCAALRQRSRAGLPVPQGDQCGAHA